MKRIAASPYRIRQFGWAIVVLAFVAGVSGCMSPYSPEHHKQLETLKTEHLAFVNEFTADAPQAVSGEKVASEASKIDPEFREAEDLAVSLKDKLRLDNVKLLHAMFNEDVSLLKEGKTFSKMYANERKEKQLGPAYDKAVEAELARPGVPK